MRDAPLTAEAAAEKIQRDFTTFLAEFAKVTSRAERRFALRDWHGHQTDAGARLDLYPRCINRLLDESGDALRALAARDERLITTRACFARRVRSEPNSELAHTFFNSIARRILDPVACAGPLAPQPGDSGPAAGDIDAAPIISRPVAGNLAHVLYEVLAAAPVAAPWIDRAADARRAAGRLEALLRPLVGAAGIDAIEMLEPVFYRDKAAYLIGRLRSTKRLLPLVLPLLHDADGVRVDAVLVHPAEASILFSFTRSYFHVAAPQPRLLVAFLSSILPLKPIADLYSSLGFHHHGKTELIRDLERHLARPGPLFEHVPGDRGLVMLVFGLPQHDRVFKVIRDSFPWPKSTTPQSVRRRYRLVFERDRVGRLVEAQEFRQLRLPRSRFSPAFLEELLNQAGRTVRVDGDDVAIAHAYTERRVRPLNLHLRRARAGETERAVIDYGQAIKELAAANIFAGDFLLKNFGVTRHGRVVFYDYDELCLLTECRFRRLPAARRPEDELAAEPWFTVGEDDVFPEEFRTFIDLRGELFEIFERHHGELLTLEFWQGLQARLEAGELMDLFPYPQSRRLRATGGPTESEPGGRG